jgi:hypothetical protein
MIRYGTEAGNLVLADMLLVELGLHEVVEVDSTSSTSTSST